MREQKERKRKNGLAIRISPVAARAPMQAHGRLLAASLGARQQCWSPVELLWLLSPENLRRANAAGCRCGLLSKQEF